MRWHDEFPELALWHYGNDERTLARPAAVAILRFECVERAGAAIGWVDLLLQAGPLRTVACGLHVDLLAAARNDEGAIVYPRAARTLFDDDETAAALTAFLVPQVRLLLRRRAVPLEDVVRFADAPAFERARERGELGAASLAQALPRVARWRSALSAAPGTPVAIDSREGDLGRAVAAANGRAVVRAAAPSPDDWYTLAPEPSGAAPGLVVSDALADPLPAPLCVAFDEPPPGAPARGVAIAAPLLIDRPYPSDPAVERIALRYWIVAAPPNIPRG